MLEKLNLSSGLFVTLVIMMSNSSAADNSHDQMHSHEQKMTTKNHQSIQDMDHSSQTMDQMFLEKRDIDGYSVSFHVMPATQSMQHGGSHNFMIKIEENGKVIDSAKINSKIIFPDGKEDSKILMKMGDWYMTGYDLNKEGRYQLMILFKTIDGKKHKGGVYYPH